MGTKQEEELCTREHKGCDMHVTMIIESEVPMKKYVLHHVMLVHLHSVL